MTEAPNKKDQTVVKLERIISTHSLDGIIFQKRDRKQTTNQILPIYEKNAKPKLNVHKSKKDVKYEKREQKEREKSPLKQTKEKKEKAVKKQKELKVRKNEKNNPMSKEKEINSKKIEESIEEKEKGKFQEKKGKEKNSLSIDKLQKSEIVENSEIREQKQGTQKQKQGIQQQNQDKEQGHLPQGSSLQQREREERIQFSKNSSLVIEASSLKNEENPRSQSVQNMVEKGKKEIKNSEEQSLKQDSEQEEIMGSESEKSQSRPQSRKGSCKKMRKREQTLLEEFELEDAVVIGGRRLRERKSKVESILEDAISDEDNEEVFNEASTKKRSSRTVQKEYHINRIFRKTDKIQMPKVSLNVDITKVSFEQFAEKFGYFEMIHFSLPISMLAKLHKIRECMTNGFIFAWVQRGEIQVGYHILNRLGFDVIDQIMWVKTNQSMSEIAHEYHNVENCGTELFQNCRETCLIGYKCSSIHKTEYCTKISNNIIFSPERKGTFHKPDQIYEIADLMMPGAKKLQIGGKEIGGWLSLKHNQTGLQRCFSCFRNQQISIKIKQKIQLDVQCLSCAQTPKAVTQNEEEKEDKSIKEGQSLIKEQIHDPQPELALKIKKLNYLDFSQSLICERCERESSQLIQLKRQNEETKINMICRDCLVRENEKYIEIKEVEIKQKKDFYLPSMKLACDFCEKKILYQYYFESTKGKTTKHCCISCMQKREIKIENEEMLILRGQGSKEKEESIRDEESEKSSSKMEEERSQRSGNSVSPSSSSKEKKSSSIKNKYRKKSDAKPEWKLRSIVEMPDMKTTCFSCREDCQIPYFACQICQNWYWCGKCEVEPKENHSHSQRYHNLHLII